MRRVAAGWTLVVTAVALLVCVPVLASAQQPLASGQLKIVGARLSVATEISHLPVQVPTNTPFTLSTRLVQSNGATDPLPLDPAFLAGLQVKARLSAPGAGNDQTLSVVAGAALLTSVGQPLLIPALARPGNYLLYDVRLEDAQGQVLLDATPASVPMQTLDTIFVSQVSSRPLSLQEIQDRGIVIGGDDFTAFEFTFGLGTESNRVNIPLDVVFPKGGGQGDGSGVALPPEVPGLSVPIFDAQGFVFDTPIDLDGIQIPPIPGVIVIPGNIAYLNGFFQVLVLVSNVTPPGSQLVITSAAAELQLPAGDVAGDTADDPLAPADTANPRPLDPLCTIAGLDPRLCAALYRTADTGAGDATVTTERAFGPGQEAQGEFVVVGRKPGTYRINVTIEAELKLPTRDNPVHLTGHAAGTVLVRDPNFSLTINHPDVVRAGETYSMFITIRNIRDLTGATDGAIANCVTLTLDPTQISGATLVSAGWPGGQQPPASSCPQPQDPGTVVVPTIAPGDAA